MFVGLIMYNGFSINNLHKDQIKLTVIGELNQLPIELIESIN